MNNVIHKFIINKKSHFWFFFVVLAFLLLFMIWTYGSVYNHPGYDYYFHLKRFDALITALREGTFPIYIDYAASLNYGYLSRVFYSDIILIPFAVLGTFVGSSQAYEVMLFTMTMLCGLFMYIAANTIYKSSYVASVASILYTFSIYRLFDVYNRGALGEVFAFTFIPLVFLGLYHIIRGDYKKWYIMAIGFSLLIFSHVISTVLTFITVVIILLFYVKPLLKQPKRFYYLVLAGIVTLFITAVYIYPLLEQIQINTYRYETNDWTLPSRAKLPLNYVLWALGCGFVYPKNISIVGIGILLTSLILLRFFFKEKSDMLKSVDIGVLIGLFYILASSSLFPWGRFPFTLLSFIQYPSRLYLLVTFLFAIGGAYYLSKICITDKSRLIIFFVLILFTGISFHIHNDNFEYMHTAYIHQTNKDPNSGNFFYLNGAEYVPDKIPSGYWVKERGDSIASIYGKTEIGAIHREKNVLNIQVLAQNSADSLELPLFYYKGYAARLNDEIIPLSQSCNGLVQIPINQSGNVKVYYEGTIVQKIGYCISIVSIFTLFIYIILQNRRNKRQKMI